MRLLRLENDGSFSLVEHIGRNIPPYAILSHTWGADHEEVTYKDLVEGTGRSKIGYRKLTLCGEWAAKDKLEWFWVDTCCIDKSSSAELSEAINSMFRWYQQSAKCYVYLADVSTWRPADGHQPFHKSRWFTRGWTLQELIAPNSAQFFSAEGYLIGNRQALIYDIAKITGIPVLALQGKALSYFSVVDRLSWIAGRQTKREEDMAYSLLGLFDIHMPLIYGEGQEKAMRRLQKEIEESQREQVLPGTTSGNHPIKQHPQIGQEASRTLEFTVEQTLYGHTTQVNSVAFSPDSTWLASGSGNLHKGSGAVMLWDSRTGKCRQHFQSLDGIKALAFSWDSSRLASGAGASGMKSLWAGGIIKLWDMDRGECVQTLKTKGNKVQSVAFSEDDRWLVSASSSHGAIDNSGRVQLWDPRIGKCCHTFPIWSKYNDYRAVAFSPDSTKIMVAVNDVFSRPGIMLGDLRRLEWLEKLEISVEISLEVSLETSLTTSSRVNTVAISPDGTSMASGSVLSINHANPIGYIHRGDIASRECVSTEKLPGNGVQSLAFSSNNVWLASGLWNKDIKLWHAKTGAHLQTLEGHSESVNSVAFSPDSTQLASGSSDKTVKIWSMPQDSASSERA